MGVGEQALKPVNTTGRLPMKGYGRQPDSGNPTVWDESGGLLKRELR